MKRVLISILARVKGNVNANGTVAALTEIKKFFTTEGETRVYVSGRCVKYCIKQRLGEKGFELSPLERPRRVAISKGNPILYIDDDFFGFMMAEVPGEAARRRFAPIKTDGIVALRHCEITRDFGGRFDPTEKEMPSPFEVEVADFIGQNNWILAENIGKFEDKEVTKDIIKESPVELEEKEEDGKKFFYLPSQPPEDRRVYGRKNRLRAFLEILLKERYTFPRAATGLHQPEYHYAVILPTERLLPLFAYVDYEVKNGKVVLDLRKIEALVSMLDEERVTIVDFERVIETEDSEGKSEEWKQQLQQLENKVKTLEFIKIVTPQKIDDVIDEIIGYLIST